MNSNYDTTLLPWCNPNGENRNNVACAADGLTVKLNEIGNAWTNLATTQIGIPTAYQIGGAKGSSWNGNAVTGLPSWLYSESNESYWTSTIYEKSAVTDKVWYVFYKGNLVTDSVIVSQGLRPVITLSKY